MTTITTIFHFHDFQSTAPFGLVQSILDLLALLSALSVTGSSSFSFFLLSSNYDTLAESGNNHIIQQTTIMLDFNDNRT